MYKVPHVDTADASSDVTNQKSNSNKPNRNTEHTPVSLCYSIIICLAKTIPHQSQEHAQIW